MQAHPKSNQFLFSSFSRLFSAGIEMWREKKLKKISLNKLKKKPKQRKQIET